MATGSCDADQAHRDLEAGKGSPGGKVMRHQVGRKSEALDDVRTPAPSRTSLLERRFIRNTMRDQAPALSTLAYMLCSMSMTLTNKFLVDTYKLNFPFALVAWQNTMTLTLLLTSHRLFPKFFDLGPPFGFAKAMAWLPGNVMFVMTLVSGAASLRVLAVPVITVLKNFGIVLVAVGDQVFFGQRVDRHTGLALVLILCSGVLSGVTDLSFSWSGYCWMLFNVTANMGYVLYTRFSLKANKKNSFDEFELCLYNCVLSIPLLLPCAWLAGEFRALSSFTGFTSPGLLVALAVSSANGFGLSLAALWCIRTNSAVHFSMVGAMAKIPLSIVGYFIFPRPISFTGGCSIAFGLISGVFYTRSKLAAQTHKADEKDVVPPAADSGKPAIRPSLASVVPTRREREPDLDLPESSPLQHTP